MVTIVKFLIGITLSFVAVQNPKSELAQNYIPVETIYTKKKDPNKQRAFSILTNKCNVCHKNRNRKRVFTEENMTPWADDVYKQVFIKKRMPKGKKIKLTSQEYQDLLTWISSTKTSNNGI